MSFDNRIFNVNGETEEMLLAALKLVFQQEGDRATAKGWSFSEKDGLILHWWAEDNDGVTPFPGKLNAEQCLPFVLAWLKSDQATTVACEGWDANVEHDGHNGPGWRVFCSDWGHVGDHHSAICAIKPVFLWYGK